MTLADFVAEKVRNHSNPLPYDLFNEIVTFAAPLFKFTSTEDASKAVQKELVKLNIEIGTQEITLQDKWPGQQHAVPFSKGAPGFLAEPMNQHHAQLNFSVGDYVAVASDTWRSKFEGTIKQIKDKTVDVLDHETGVIYEDIPNELITKPNAKGRPIVSPQYRRIGDPVGLMDSPRDIGDSNMTRSYPGCFMIPLGQEGDTVVNPPNMFYTSLKQDIEKYLEGQAVDLSSGLIEVLNKQGLLRLP